MHQREPLRLQGSAAISKWMFSRGKLTITSSLHFPYQCVRRNYRSSVYCTMCLMPYIFPPSHNLWKLWRAIRHLQNNLHGSWRYSLFWYNWQPLIEIRWCGSLLRSAQVESVTRVSGNRLTLSELVELKTMVRSSVPPVKSNIPIHFMLRKLG